MLPALQSWRDDCPTRFLWERCFVRGFAPSMPTPALASLREALITDDARLIQGATTSPPPLMCVQDWPAEAADAVGFVGVVLAGGFGVATVGECEEYFARACHECDQHLDEPAACRYFLNWFDDAPRDYMRRMMIVTISAILEERKHPC